MKRQDLHTHSLFDDGKNTLGQMALATQAAGLSAIGLSGHSPLPFPNDWAISEARFGDYLAEARRLREAYREDFRVWVGLEWDTRSPEPPAELDYVIGSVHGLPAPDAGFSVDESAEALRACLDTVYAGDARAMEAAYYAGYDKIAANPRVDIVGHFDLITKFDEPHAVFSAMPDCAARAMEKLVKAGKIFEINTGAIARGYRQTPYPSEPLLRLLRELGGKILLSSDAHSVGGLGFGCAESLALAGRCGFTELWQYDGAAFVPVEL